MKRHAPKSGDTTEELSEALFADAPVALCVIGRNLRILAVNGDMAALLDHRPQDIVGRPVEDVLSGAQALARRWFERAAAGRPTLEQEWSDPRSGRTYLATARALFDADGTAASLSVALTDITRRRQLRADIALRERRLGVALESAGQWIWELDVRSGRVRRSPHWKTALGFGPDDVSGEDEHVAWAVVHPDDRPGVLAHYQHALEGSVGGFEAVYRMPDSSGQWRWILGRGRIVERDAEGHPLRLLATSVDITSQKRIEEELAATVRERERLEGELLEANHRLTELSEIDALTQLPNRRKFDAELEREAARSDRSGRPFALMMIDVDDFKSYNDLYGHIEGDDCLRRIAEALRGCTPPGGSLVSRYGGEEFAVILSGAEEKEAVAIAADMLRAIRALHLSHAGSASGFVTVSIGVAVRSPADGTASAPRLLAGADHALYAAKEGGRDRVLVRNPDNTFRAVPLHEGTGTKPASAARRAGSN